MKRIIVIAALILAVAGVSFSQSSEVVTVKGGQQKTASRSKLKIRFVEVTEDSRCPPGTQCIWAGNAKIRLEVITKGGGKKMVEANTSTGPKGDQFDGWAIELVTLSPRTNSESVTGIKKYVAKISVTRLQR